jgi:DNA replication protein DnaC
MAKSYKGPEWIYQSIERMQALQANDRCGSQRQSQEQRPVWLDKALRAAGVGKVHAGLLLSGPPLQDTTSLLAAKRFSGSPQKWCLILAGNRGVGKTLASEWLLLQHFLTLKTQPTLKKNIFSTFQVMRSRQDNSLLDRMMTADVAVFDDLGVEILDQPGAFLWCLFETINHRWSNRLQTVITSNLSPAEFGARYGNRVTDRLRDGGVCIVAKSHSLR